MWRLLYRFKFELSMVCGMRHWQSRAAPLEAESHEAQASQHASASGKLLSHVGLLETYLRHISRPAAPHACEVYSLRTSSLVGCALKVISVGSYRYGYAADA